MRLPSWQIWAEKWFRRCIFTKLKSNSPTRCCEISDLICVVSSSTRWRCAAAEILIWTASFTHSFGLAKVSWVVKASETFFLDVLEPNQQKTSFWLWNSSRQFSMYSIVASIWCRYCAIWWKYTTFLVHNKATAKGIFWLAEGFIKVAVKTGTITCLSAFIYIPLHCVTWQYGLLDRVKPGYGGIITQRRLNFSILECCSRKDVTQSNKYLGIPG